MRNLARLVLVAALLGATSAPSAQESPQANLRRTIPVTVLNRQGKPVAGLTPQNLQGEFGGKPVNVVSVKWDTRPRRIVVLLDASDSMAWNDKWALARRGAEDIIMHMRPEDQVAALAFADSVISRIEFGQGGSGGVARLAVLPVKLTYAKGGGRTALLDALLESLRLVEPARPGDAVYVVTDGADNASKSTTSQLRSAVACSEARLFFLLLWDSDDKYRGLEYRYGPYLADELAELTGGSAAAPRFVEEGAVAAAARSLYSQMMEFYSVEIELPHPIDKRRHLSLKIVDEKGKKMPGVSIAYPRELAPCAASIAGSK